MSKWLVTGDWQAEFRNLSQCGRAHRQEMGLLRSGRVQGVIDTGDLKENYNNGDYRALEFQVRRAREISKIGPFIANLGNHDRYGQYDDSSNWFSILRMVSPETIKEEPGTAYEDENVAIHVLPYRNDRASLIKDAVALDEKCRRNSQAKLDVLIFHCNLNGATFANGGTSDSHITLKDLRAENYDFCFGGDIHRRQMLSNNVWYVGTPICHDWGEANLWKGFCIFDDANKTVEWLKSDVPNWYTFDYLTNPRNATEAKQIVNIQNARIKAVIEVTQDKYVREVEKTHRTVKQLYPKAIVTVKAQFREDEKAEDIQLKGNQSDADSLNAYLTATLPKRLVVHRDKIFNYMQSLLNNATSVSGMRSVARVNLLSAHAENMLSYKLLDFDYRKRGVCLAHGINTAWPKRSIGAGKSNFLGMIPVAWFGRTFKKAQKSNKLAYEHNKKKALAQLMAEVDGEKILVERGARPFKLRMLINGKDQSSGNRHKGKQDGSQGLLEQKIGFTFNTLASAVYIDSGFSNAFLNGTDKDRAQLISTFQNLERFELAQKFVAREVARVKDSIDDLEHTLEIEQAGLEERKNTLAILLASSRASLSVLKKEAIRTGCEYTRVRKALNEFHTQYGAKLRHLETKLDNLREKEKLMESKHYRWTRDAEDHKAELKRLTSGEQLVCPTCERPLSEDVIYNAKQAARKNLVEALQKRTDCEKVHRIVRVKLGKMNAEYKRLSQEGAAIEAKGTTAKDAADRASLVYRKEKERVEDTQIKKYRRRCKEQSSYIARCKGTLKDYEKEQVELHYVLTAFSRNGLPQFLNTLIRPALNAAAKEYSELFTDGEIQVRFLLEDGMFVPKIVNLHGSKTIAGQSTGELAWASNITAFALRVVGPKTNVLILDEPGNGLDPESAIVFARALKKLTDRFETILVTSHNTQIVAELDGRNTVTVKKIGGASVLTV